MVDLLKQFSGLCAYSAGDVRFPAGVEGKADPVGVTSEWLILDRPKQPAPRLEAEVKKA